MRLIKIPSFSLPSLTVGVPVSTNVSTVPNAAVSWVAVFRDENDAIVGTLASSGSADSSGNYTMEITALAGSTIAYVRVTSCSITIGDTATVET